MSTTIPNELKRYLNEIGSLAGKYSLGKLSNSSAQTTTPTSTPTLKGYIKTDWEGKRKEAKAVKNAAIKAADEAKINSQDAVDQAYNRLLKEAEESYEKDSKTANARLKAQLGALLDAKSKSEQTANINYQKLLKYLPERLSAQGLSGLGTSQGAYIRATNDLNNRFVDIMGKYTEGRTAAEGEYGNAMSALRATRVQKEQAAEDRRVQDTQRLEDRYSIDTGAALDRYNAKMDSIDSMEFSENQNKKALDREDANRRTEQAAALIQNGYFESGDELRKWYENKEGTFGASNDYIDSIVNSTLDSYDKLEQEDAWNKAVKTGPSTIKFDSDWVGDMGTDEESDTFDLKVNGADRELTAIGNGAVYLSELMEDKSIPRDERNAIARVAYDSFFIWRGDLYIKTTEDGKPIIAKIDPNEHTETYSQIYNQINTMPKDWQP